VFFSDHHVVGGIRVGRGDRQHHRRVGDPSSQFFSTLDLSTAGSTLSNSTSGMIAMFSREPDPFRKRKGGEAKLVQNPVQRSDPLSAGTVTQ
jgi:hypothetical protein